MSDRLALERAVRRAPGSVVNRSAMADWLEENGEQDAADAHRWLAAWKKRPLRAEREYYWIAPANWRSLGSLAGDRPAVLPDALYLALWAAHSPRRHLAEAAVVDAWPRALAAGWVPGWPPVDAPRCGPSPLRGAYAVWSALQGVPSVPWDTPTAPTPLDDVQAAVEATLTHYDPALAASLAPPPA